MNARVSRVWHWKFDLDVETACTTDGRVDSVVFDDPINYKDALTWPVAVDAVE